MAEKNSTYVVRLFVHNNSPRAYECVAKDVMVKFDISETVYVDSRNVELAELNSKNGYYSAAIKGSITSSNASPKEYYDGVRFISKEPFHLKYVYGTAEYNNNHFKNGYILSDDIIKKHIRIGYDKMDGNIPGCYEYSGVATIKVMPFFDN